ncbi:hypothetical protein ACMFMF_010188 [Clarireedia jacksonii]
MVGLRVSRFHLSSLATSTVINQSMTTYLQPEVFYESSSITHSTTIPTKMPSQLFTSSIEKLLTFIIRGLSYIVFLALILVTGLIWLVRFILQRTGLWALGQSVWARTPQLLKKKWDERQYKRRERNKKKMEDLLQDESLARGRKEKAQIKEAMVKVGWKRGVGKMDFGIDMKEDDGRRSALNKGEEGIWVEDEVVAQDADLLQTLENKADFGKIAGIRDQAGRGQGRIPGQNRDTEEFPKF